MGKYKNDSRVVLTLDAGGTNMVFGAMRSEEYIIDPITLPSNANDLDLCLETMVTGFRSVINQLGGIKPSAISFAFPGPADYAAGIIGGFLPNFPSFRDGVALGPYLKEVFGVPVFINNDGDLYAFGEALGGVLPEVNEKLLAMGSSKQYHNLIGYTFGTGFGMGCVINDQLNRGDNCCAETWCLPHPFINGVIVEEGVAIRAVKRVYAEQSGVQDASLTPKDIFDIAEGRREGNPEAAKAAFAEMGRTAGRCMAVAGQLMDGLIVIGGGITASHKYFMPALLAELRGTVRTLSGDTLQRMQMKVYDLDDEAEFAAFAKGDARELKIYGTDKTVTYDPQKRIGIMISKIGASKAISVGAYDFALSQLDA
ncbi:MAG: ROK family protein [Bacteroidales bacterium]|nr:ROK family protein [Bacteroidales bacterium]MBP5374682.1 ROK family protein [Bacteroidales bacterium]